MTVTGHVFIATSLDGYIARPDGNIDWLLARDDPGEDHGYDDFIADKDMVVMGRGTYESVLGLDEWFYTRPVLVLSRQLAGTAVPERLAGKVRFADWTPEQAMAQLAREGVRRVYVDGGQVVQAFLRAGLIEDMVVTSVPVLLGAGRRLFGELAGDVPLQLMASRSFPSGLVQSAYRVLA